MLTTKMNLCRDRRKFRKYIKHINLTEQRMLLELLEEYGDYKLLHYST